MGIEGILALGIEAALMDGMDMAFGSGKGF
jgi:hypothetical protein